MAESPCKTLLVEAKHAGERLDRYLAAECPGISRSQLKQLIEAGDVTVEAKAAKPSHKLRGGERVMLTVPPPEAPALVPEDIPLKVLYEDADLLVLDKPAEMVVHLGAGVKQGTLVNALLHHCKDLSGIGGVARPGIVHRLDKGTSGLLVVAKNDRAHQGLSSQFQSRRVAKTYLAFVWGRPRDASGKIDVPLGRSERDRKRIASHGRKLRPAVTRYRVLKRWPAMALLELKPETGRTHQLRVHLAELGNPIVGDPTYGRRHLKASELSPELTAILQETTFQLLHAWRLSFEHPVTGKVMSFEAPMRAEMETFQKLLEKSP
ncbi:MAG: RluA family pseudouridine synthase [Deltaproteobacteria bacterium]|nr:RluA family pseudouridine synthase [Deltaproteobacteria bacterium]